MTDRTETLPERVGPYRVLQLLGQGGMGAVYEAEETGPVRRRLAVKVVRPGSSSRGIVARFEAERQALALMNHPGIAKVFAAGTTDDGAPYFSMELVRGLPITDYCDTHRLAIAERLRLFINVCRAVQHAHQKGVVHRDLKPSNILVVEQDGAPQVKIIDFGVAKAVGQQLTEDALVTMTGTAVGTAAYMSPEQADVGSVDIDTRADIYSLGVMLYELLVGELPIDPTVSGVHAFLAALASRDSHVQTPSARLSRRQDTGTATVTYARRTDHKRLWRQLHGDLDWIVMKAMQPERMLRYESAASLAEDLLRHLANQPVSARPPSTRDRFDKFVRRHRMGVVAVAAVMAAIVLGAVVATIGFVRATRAERLAAQEAEAARKVTNFMIDLFRSTGPENVRNDTMTAGEIMRRGAARVNTQLASEPIQQARLLVALGQAHQQLGLFAEAAPLFDSAVRIRERQLGPDAPEVAEALKGLGDAVRMKGDLPLADSAYSRALRIRAASFGTESIEYASSLAALATLRWSQGKFPKAESLYRAILPLDQRLRPETDPLYAKNIRNLATVLFSQGRYGEADSLYKRALAMQERTLGSDHYEYASTLNNLGGNALMAGHFEEALRYFDEARPVLERTLDPLHQSAIGLVNNRGEALWKLKRYREAEPLLREALAKKEKKLGPDHVRTSSTLNALAGLLRDEGRYREAEALYKRALQIREKAAPQDVPETLRDYAELLRRAGRSAEAAQVEARVAAIKAAR